jgi:hypothetical protein
VSAPDSGYVSEMAEIVAALALSPISLYHYRAPIWWGRKVEVRIALVRREGDWSAAKITAPTGTQWVLLHRRRVVTWVTQHAVEFYCRDAPPGVIVRLVGGCQLTGRYAEDVVILGRTDRRRVAGSFRGCLHPIVYASRLDPSWTEVDNCATSGGDYFLHHGKLVQLEIDGPGCNWGPPGIIRSLHGRCLLVP